MFIDSWEIECCVPPPGVGDAVAWRLLWLNDPAGPGVMTAAWRTSALGGGLLLTEDGLSAWWPDPLAAGVPAVGRLLAVKHGPAPEELRPTWGTVLGVQVVEHLYRFTDGAFRSVAGDYALRAVPRSPRWFDNGAAERPSPFRAESGVLVDVRVSGPATG